MILAAMAAMAAGAFATTMVLWLTGAGGATSGQAVARLQTLRGQRVDVATPSTPGTSLRKRATVRLAGMNVVSGNIATNWAIQLERAGLTLNVKEYFILRTVVAVAAGGMGLLLIPIPFVGAALAPIAFLGVGQWVKLRIGSRRRKLEAQLTELLSMVASGLRAGFGLVQALESSGSQMPEPISLEIRRAMRDIAVGASVEQSLEALNKRVGSPDFDIAITAILIQRAVGGNLAEILDNVSHTMRERERIRGEIRTLTSQQRLTGFVIGGIPPCLLGIFWTMNPQFTSLLFTESLGQMMLGAGIVMEAVGFFVIKKIVDIEV
jgi:tight adherence protein B